MLTLQHNKHYQTAVATATTSIAATTLLGVAIITLHLQSDFWGQLLVTLGLVSLASTGILSCMSALKFPHLRAICVIGFVFIALAFVIYTITTWLPDAPNLVAERGVFSLWGFVAAQVSLLYRFGESTRRGWNRWLAASSTCSFLTAALLTPMTLGIATFFDDVVIRIALVSFSLAAAGGVVLPAMARLLPNLPVAECERVEFHPTIVLTSAQSAEVRQHAASCRVTERQFLDTLLTGHAAQAPTGSQ